MIRSQRRIHKDPSVFALAVATALLALTAIALITVSGAAASPCAEAILASTAP